MSIYIHIYVYIYMYIYIYIHTYIHTYIHRYDMSFVVARVPERAQLAQRHRPRVREHPHRASGQQGGTAQPDCPRFRAVTFRGGDGFCMDPRCGRNRNYYRCWYAGVVADTCGGLCLCVCMHLYYVLPM